MFRSFFIVAWRNFRKNKGHAFINIAGLTIGIASCLLIALFVGSELKYDCFHDNAERIYRAGLKFHVGSNQFDAALGPCPLADALVRDFPEVKSAARVFARQSRGGDVFVRYEEKRYREERFLWADASIFEVLTIPLLKGDSSEALSNPNSVVLTTKAVKKYFAEEDPMGKMLALEDGSLYRVTGVTEGWSHSSHFYFDFLASFSSLPKSKDHDFYDTAVFTYFSLKENVSPESMQSKLPEFSGKYMAPVIEKIMAVSYEDFLKSGNYIGFMIQPLLDIHLRSDWGNELDPQGNITIVFIFSAIAVLILIVACVNFINLTTARSSQRAGEVGIRKVVGSSRGQLVRQFLTESVLLSLTAVVSALALVELVLPAFNRLIGADLNPGYFLNGYNMMLLLLGALGLGVAAGSYPAFLMASFKPVDVLKGRGQLLLGRSFRGILVIFQFCASIILLVGTIVIYCQLHYIRTLDLGFEKEHVIVVQRAEKLGNQQEAFKNRMMRESDILQATYTDSLPQILLEAKVFQKEGEGSQQNNTLITITTDYEFKDTYGLEMLKGRFFDRERSTDKTAVVLNETAVRSLGIKNPLEERLVLVGLNRRPMEIIGIIKDFHMESLHVKIGPTAVILRGLRPGVLLSVRVKPDDLQETLRLLETRWNEFTNNQPFEYTFFDDQFNSLYRNEIRGGRVIAAFAGLAVFIACLGLLALASFTVGRRTKEIGVRKILGASVNGILILLNKDLAKQVVVANVLAWPIAYFAMNRWLQNFAYRIALNLWMFAGAAGMAFFMAVLTVSIQSYNAARVNPVDSLRYE